jgi:sporulation protein YlmC with PRC-barrel domain
MVRVTQNITHIAGTRAQRAHGVVKQILPNGARSEQNGIPHVSQRSPAEHAFGLRGGTPGKICGPNQDQGRQKMLKSIIVASAVGLLSVSAYAAQNIDFPSASLANMIPQNAMTVTDWYKQAVYDPNNNKIGEIMDVLVDKSGKISTLIVGVGGFLGAGEKDVAVGFDQIHTATKNDKMYLVMNTTKDNLKSAAGFKYDRSTTTWVPDQK